MTNENFQKELYLRVDDYFSNNLKYPKHLLINPLLIEAVDIGSIDLQIVPSDKLQENELVVY